MVDKTDMAKINNSQDGDKIPTNNSSTPLECSNIAELVIGLKKEDCDVSEVTMTDRQIKVLIGRTATPRLNVKEHKKLLRHPIGQPGGY